MRKFTIIILTVMMTVACSLFGRSSEFNNTPVTQLDLNRYLGTWYEIARFDHSFERGIEYAQADYSLKEDGTIKVFNSGMKNGKFKSSTGKAFLPDTNTPALLRVSFFGPFYSDYRVLMVSPDYKYALVGSGKAKYLWILSRTPVLPEDVKQAILDEAVRRGYDISKLIWVAQDISQL